MLLFHQIFDTRQRYVYYFYIQEEMSMYQGTNPTALQSQKWITESLIKLMSVKPYHQITIMDICKQADLSRQTFYNVFDKKEDILRFSLQNSCEEQLSPLMHQERTSFPEIVSALAGVLEENEELLSMMINNNLEGIILDIIAKSITMVTDSFVKNERKKELLPYSKTMVSGALAHLIVYWFRQENPVSIEQLTDLILEFLNGKLLEL